jgi:hypothetical protein
MKRYRLYIDESGDHTYAKLEDSARRYLCLLGLFVEVETYRTSFHSAFEGLKQAHFPHIPDEPVIMHRTEIINRRGPFGRLKDPGNEQLFNADLLKFLFQQDYRLIGVVIDKKTHVERYGSAAYHPYHFCLAALLERYCGFLKFYNAQGDVMAESRGGNEDIKLKEAYHSFYTAGTYYRPPDFFQRALTSCQMKLKPKSANIAGLQVADLLAYPVKQEILLDNHRISDSGDVFSKEICKIIVSKYNQQVYEGRISGYGKVFLA